MGVPATTTEATMRAIQDRLDQLHVMLGRIAGRQDKMLVDLKKTTAALASSTATTSTFMSGRVLEQHTKPSSSSLFSVVQVGGAGTSRADAILASSTPTMCSTVGSAVNVGCNHVLVAFPTSGTTHLPPMTTIEVGNNTLQDMGEAGVNTPTGCSTHVLSWPRDLPGACALGVDTDMSAEVLTHVGGVSLFLEPCLEPAGVVFSEPHPIEFEDDVFTIVGGFSLFMELAVESADGMLMASNVKNIMCNEGLPESEHEGAYMQQLLWCNASLGDIAQRVEPLAKEYSHDVLIHVGSSSLFLKQVRKAADKQFDVLLFEDVSRSDEAVSWYNRNTFDPGIVTVSVECWVLERSSPLQCRGFSPGSTIAKSEDLVYGSSNDPLSVPGDPRVLHSREIHGSDIATLFMPWDPGEWINIVEESKLSTDETSYIGGWSSWLRQRSNQELQDNLRNKKFFSQGVGMSDDPYGTIFIKLELKQQVNCSMCIHMFGDTLFGMIRNFKVLLDYTSLWPTEVKMDKYSTEAGHLSIFLGQKLNEGLKASNSYIMEDTLAAHVVVRLLFHYTFTSSRLIVWSSFSREENAEKRIMLMEMYIPCHGYALHSNQQSKLHTAQFGFLMWSSRYVQMSWEPGDMHCSALSSRLLQSTLCAALLRPWDPGIVTIHEVAVPVYVQARKFQRKRWSFSSSQPALAIAWGQAMFFGGGNVMPTWRRIILGMVNIGLGLRDVDCWPYSAAI